MRKITRNLFLAGGVALSAGVISAPALADVDFRFGINVGPPAYYYAPPPRPYYYAPRTYYYYDY
jgi:hypothetical protein